MRILIRCISLTLLLAVGAQAQIPRTISYQGILTDTSGTPRPDGAYAMTFRLYASISGGSAIWSESKSLQLKGGLFSTSLGDATPFPGSLLFNSQYWLSVQVGGGTELAPRTAMTATPYSLSSEKADSARIAGGVGPNAVTTSGIVDNAVTSAKIQNSSIQFADIGQNGAAGGQVMKWNGSSWAAGNDSVGVAGGSGPWQLNGSSAYYNGGNVGIGTSSPGFPLNFGSTLGDKISLWGQSGPHYGIGIQSGQLQIHTDIAGSDILFGYGTSGAFTERMRIKGNGNVGIGISTPNAPLTFAPALGKKITLYPGATGDVGFGVAGNRLQIYSDNPNADVAIGYDAAGVFNERFAVKPTGALAVGGNIGGAGQLLSSNGNAAATWINNPVTDMYGYAEEITATAYILLSSGQVGDLPGLTKTLVLTKNAKVIVQFMVHSFGQICTLCGSSLFVVLINVDGSEIGRTPGEVLNGHRIITNGTRILSLNPGTHTIKIMGANEAGPNVEFGGTLTSIYKSLMLIQVIPQQ